MIHQRFFKLGLFLICFCLCSLQKSADAVPVPIRYTNINHWQNNIDAVSHFASEFNLNILMEFQNSLNGFPDYFNNSTLGNFVNKASSTIGQVADTASNVYNTAVGTVDTAVGTVTGAVSGTVTAVKDTAGNLVDQGVDAVTGVFSSDNSKEKAGEGFVKKKSSSQVVNNFNKINPIDRLVQDKEEKPICENLNSPIGVAECFYLDNSKKLTSHDIKNIHSQVSKEYQSTIKKLYADSAAVVNATGNFKEAEQATTDETPKTVSETLTKRAETDLGYNVIGGAYLGLELSRLEMDSMIIYRTINSIKVGGGF